VDNGEMETEMVAERDEWRSLGAMNGVAEMRDWWWVYRLVVCLQGSLVVRVWYAAVAAVNCRRRRHSWMMMILRGFFRRLHQVRKTRRKMIACCRD
jgi:hypothetical protein